MRQDAWRTYLEMAMGMTDVSRKRATKAVRRVLGKGGATAEQLHDLAAELLRTSVANRESLTNLIRFELERALGRVGVATAEEMAALVARVDQLESELRQASAPTAEPAPEAMASARKAPARKAPARKTAVKKATANATSAEKAAPVKKATPARKTAAKKATSDTASTSAQDQAQGRPAGGESA